MAKYLVKQIFDGEVLVGYQVMAKTNAKHLPRGNKHIFVEGPVTDYPIVVLGDGDVLEVIEDTKPMQLNALHDDMISDVYNELENVFGTKNDIAIQATASTYEAMLKRPANYVDAELGFTTEAEVIAAAEAWLNAADAYGVYRLKRRAKYEADKAAIEAGV